MKNEIKDLKTSGKVLTLEGGYKYSEFAKYAFCDMLDKMKSAVRYHNMDKDGKIMVTHSLLFAHGLKQHIHCGYHNRGARVYTPRANTKDWNLVRQDLHKEKQSKTKFDLCSPALVEAYDRGLLNGDHASTIYKEIKNGGLTVLEKYSRPSIGVSKIYMALEELYEPKTVRIVVGDDENFSREVQMKKRKFEQDKQRYMEELLQPRVIDDVSNEEIELMIGIKSSLDELNLDEDIGNISKPSTKIKKTNRDYRNQSISKPKTLRDILK